VDRHPHEGAPVAPEEPPYRLPSPLHQHGAGLPVSPSAPRIPRALRAFNGMPPVAEPPPVVPPRVAPRGARPREPQRTIRDLLLDTPETPEETGLMAGLRSAWRRLRQPGEEEETGDA
jgi:hypothetical protein